MSRFTEILLVSPLPDGSTWVIMKPFGYDVGQEGSPDRVNVPVGFQTDFASIPRIFWFILPKWGKYGNAAVIHDWLYWEQDRARSVADAIFLEAMAVLGVGCRSKYPIYWAVRLFGRLAWYRNQRDRAEGFDRVLSTLPQKTTAEVAQRAGVLRHAVRQVRSRLGTRPGSPGAA